MAMITAASKHERPNPTTFFSFLSLPIELRRKIYIQYLLDLFPCRDVLTYENIIIDKVPSTPLLQVNSQVYSEVREASRSSKQRLDLELSWQGLRIDPLSVLSMRMCSDASAIASLATADTRLRASPKVLDESLEFEAEADKSIPYLRVKIFAPHPERSTDIFCIWFYAKILCTQLRGYYKIRRLVIDFQESTVPLETLPPSWSKAGIQGLPKRSLENLEHLYYNDVKKFPDLLGWWDYWNDNYNSDDQEANCDLRHIVDLFSAVSNVSTAKINLPPSLIDNTKLRTMVQEREGIMTKQCNPLFRTDREYERYTHGMENLFLDCRPELVLETGRNSLRRLLRLPYDTIPKEPRTFQETWPHICCLAKYPAQALYSEWPDKWIQGSITLTPCLYCTDYDDDEPSIRTPHFSFRRIYRVPVWKGGALETLGGPNYHWHEERNGKSTGYWQLRSLFR
ncbi:MAG: hypothetical protein Q9208_002867 [Pyrenodesmia sp. 3 TL-2023]